MMVLHDENIDSGSNKGLSRGWSGADLGSIRVELRLIRGSFYMCFLTSGGHVFDILFNNIYGAMRDAFLPVVAV